MFFEFLIPQRPLSVQAKSKNLQRWKQFVYNEAAKTWSNDTLYAGNLHLTLVYLFDSNPADIDNIIKPIQDSLIGLVYSDDAIITDVQAHRRSLYGTFDITRCPDELIKGITLGTECVCSHHRCGYIGGLFMMANPMQYPRESDLRSRVAEKYMQDGYEVVIEPKQKDLPFDLGTYRPDLLVKKPGGEGYIIEIKRSASQASVERYREVAKFVADNAGWRFLLVTGDDNLPGEQGNQDQLLSWEEIARRKEKSDRLVAIGELEAAFLSLWSLVEALMRKHAEQALIPIEQFPPLSLIKHLYSQGELSIEQYNRITPLLNIRNRVVHGYQTTELSTSVVELQALVGELLSSWMALEQQ